MVNDEIRSLYGVTSSRYFFVACATHLPPKVGSPTTRQKFPNTLAIEKIILLLPQIAAPCVCDR
jgi:hypothetical protein